jgi:tungstate transport system substrate-binding protein
MTFFKSLISIVLFLFASTTYSDSNILRLASTTSNRASGLLDVVIPAFEKKTGYKVSRFVTGSGKAMQLGRTGKVDLLWVHSPEAEKEFIRQGHGLKRRYTMHNDFLIVCPMNDPADIGNASNIVDAMQRIANTKSLFISRADESGTHKSELQLWQTARIEPYGSWYYELGHGMKMTLKVSNDKQAYLLIDRGTWLFNRKNTTLKECFQGASALLTEYSLIAVNPANHNKINNRAAKAFIKYVNSKIGKSLIRNHKIEGKPLFKVKNSLK